MATNTIEVTEGGVKILVPATAFTAKVVSGSVELKTSFATYSVSENLTTLKNLANASAVNVIEVTENGNAVLIPARNFTAKVVSGVTQVRTAWTTFDVSQTLNQLQTAANL